MHFFPFSSLSFSPHTFLLPFFLSKDLLKCITSIIPHLHKEQKEGQVVGGGGKGEKEYGIVSRY